MHTIDLLRSKETILERAKQKMVLDHLVIQSMDSTKLPTFGRFVTKFTLYPPFWYSNTKIATEAISKKKNWQLF